MGDNNKITVRIIDNEQDFEAIKNEWDELLKASNSDNIFLTWEWLYTWWKYFGKGKKLLIVLAEENDKIIGIAPLYLLTKVRYFGIRPLSHIEFIGSTNSSSEYLDFILMRGREQEILSLILKKLVDCKTAKWDTLNLVSIKKASENLELFRRFSRENNHIHRDYGEFICPFIVLPGSLDEFFMTLNPNSRQKFRKYRRNFEKDYVVSLIHTENKDDLDRDFRIFVDLHQKRWTEKDGKGAFTETRENYKEFHNEIASRFFDKGWLYLVSLKAGDKIVAAQYDFIYGEKIYCFQVGFDPEWAKSRVATVLQIMVIEDGIKRGLIEFDFLRGTEDYKFIWTKESRPSINSVIWKSKVTFYEISFERKIRGIIKFLFPAILKQKIYSSLFSRK